MFKAVIFDLDGTLITFTLDVRACRTEIIHNLAQLGFQQSLFSLRETAFDMLIKVKQQISDEKTVTSNFTEIQKMVFSVVERFELESAKTTQMFQGIPDTLKALKEMNLKTAICTISGNEATSYSLKRFQVEQYFDAIITREKVTNVKPHPEHLQATLDALNIKPNEAVLVGDSVKDMQCANKLDVLAVGVTTGLSSKESLIDAGAHYISSSANDVLVIMKHLNRKK
ncbi:MAG: HAD family hydrolase [Candidatus Bathyarchaeia archaeon]|jgi:HAD superfamily hydrolase (TIGR01549 family)